MSMGTQPAPPPQEVGIPYKSGTGCEESLGKTQMQCLLEQEDLEPLVQRQAKELLESITQQRTATPWSRNSF